MGGESFPQGTCAILARKTRGKGFAPTIIIIVMRRLSFLTLETPFHTFLSSTTGVSSPKMSLDPTLHKIITLLAPSLALTTSTSILSYSIFLAPLVKSILDTDTTRALTQLCSYFRAGKPTVPPAAILNTLLFTALAYLEPSKRVGYGIGAIGAFSIIPFSMAYIIPVTNDRLLELERVAKRGEEVDREEVRRLVGDFERENWLRGGMYWVGGMVGLWTAIQ